METFEGSVKARWEEMLLKGVFRVRGMDEESGEFEYELDLERLKEVDLDLYNLHQQEVDSSVMELFQRGIIDLEFTEDGVVGRLTEKGQMWAEAANLSFPE